MIPNVTTKHSALEFKEYVWFIKIKTNQNKTEQWNKYACINKPKAQDMSLEFEKNVKAKDWESAMKGLHKIKDIINSSSDWKGLPMHPYLVE